MDNSIQSPEMVYNILEDSFYGRPITRKPSGRPQSVKQKYRPGYSVRTPILRSGGKSRIVPQRKMVKVGPAQYKVKTTFKKVQTRTPSRKPVALGINPLTRKPYTPDEIDPRTGKPYPLDKLRIIIAKKRGLPSPALSSPAPPRGGRGLGLAKPIVRFTPKLGGPPRGVGMIRKSTKVSVKPKKKKMRWGKQKRKSKKLARKEAKSLGLRGKSKRKFIRAAKQDVVVKKIVSKAMKKGPKAQKRLLAKAERIKKLEGKSRAGQVAKKVAKGVATATILAPLIPLRPMMRKTLKDRAGISTSKKINTVDLANKFYKNVVLKNKKSWETYPDIDLDQFDSDHAAVALPVIVDAILSFVKNVKKKKASGQPLTKVEKTVNTGTVLAEEKIEQTAKDEAAREVGSRLLFDKKTMFIAGGVLLAIIAVFFLAGKGSRR